MAEEERFHQLLDRILDYKVGAYEKFDDALPGEMEGLKVNIALFGMTGAGKSALINTIFKSLGLSPPAITQTAGSEGTRVLESFDLPSDVTLFDTAGFFDLGKIEEGELFRILYGIERAGDDLTRDHASAMRAMEGGVGAHKYEKPPIADQKHVVLWVLRANDIRFQLGMYREIINFVLNMLKREIISIITVITFDDEVQKMENPGEKRARIIEAASEITECRKSNVYFIANSVTDQEEYPTVNKTHVLEMLEHALKCGERSIKTRQSQRESPKKYSRAVSEPQGGGLRFPVENTEPPDHLGHKSLP